MGLRSSPVDPGAVAAPLAWILPPGARPLAGGGLPATVSSSAQGRAPAPRTLVVGAGIGGLCGAIALRRRGVEVRVVDQATDLAPLGAGLTLWPNAVHALRRLGLAEAIEERSYPIGAGGIRSRQGTLLLPTDPAELERRVGAPTLAIHRGELQAALVEALGAPEPELGARLEGLEASEEEVRARFAGGRERRVDLLLGADGLESVVRTHVIGDSPPRPAGYSAWRGVTRFDVEALPVGELWGPGAVFGFVPLGPERVYWFGTKPESVEEREDAGGRKEDVLSHFEGWHHQVEAVVRASPEEEILHHDIVDRDPRRGWSQGRVTLMGDAAHPMTPHLGQGACQAIEDAAVLVDCLDREHDMAAGLRAYEARRFDRTAKLVVEARRLGRIAQLRNPLAQGLRDAVLKLVPRRVQLRQLEAMTRFPQP